MDQLDLMLSFGKSSFIVSKLMNKTDNMNR